MVFLKRDFLKKASLFFWIIFVGFTSSASGVQKVAVLSQQLAVYNTDITKKQFETKEKPFSFESIERLEEVFGDDIHQLLYKNRSRINIYRDFMSGFDFAYKILLFIEIKSFVNTHKAELSFQEISQAVATLQKVSLKVFNADKVFLTKKLWDPIVLSYQIANQIDAINRLLKEEELDLSRKIRKAFLDLNYTLNQLQQVTGDTGKYLPTIQSFLSTLASIERNRQDIKLTKKRIAFQVDGKMIVEDIKVEEQRALLSNDRQLPLIREMLFGVPDRQVKKWFSKLPKESLKSTHEATQWRQFVEDLFTNYADKMKEIFKEESPNRLLLLMRLFIQNDIKLVSSKLHRFLQYMNEALQEKYDTGTYKAIKFKGSLAYALSFREYMIIVPALYHKDSLDYLRDLFQNVIGTQGRIVITAGWEELIRRRLKEQELLSTAYQKFDNCTINFFIRQVVSELQSDQLSIRHFTNAVKTYLLKSA